MASLKAVVAATGCKLNQAEADLWKALLEAQGYEAMEEEASDEEASLCLVTTCTVTEPADRSSVALVRRLHRKYPHAEIKVTGCGAEANPQKFSSLPGVTEIIQYKRKEASIADVLFSKSEPGCAIKRNRAFLRIADGCDRRCTYCIVSRIRGPVKSKPAPEILSELNALAEAGFGEVVLVALNLGLWGHERGENLASLLERIDCEKRKLPRIRLTSLEPDTIDDRLMEIVGGSSRICPHLHVPLQSGDNEVLTRMDRPYNTSDFARLVEGIIARIPDASIGTDIITSTPAEDEASFTRTLEFVRSMPFSYLHAFTYSPRPGTPMALEKRGPNPRERTKTLREVGANKSLEYRKRFVGSTREAVVLSKTRVLTDNYVDVRIHATDAAIRSLMRIEITGADEKETRGSLETITERSG
jgi:threonylcarbamoyladenosine tRNA methylthiotransferase MtaB